MSFTLSTVLNHPQHRRSAISTPRERLGRIALLVAAACVAMLPLAGCRSKNAVPQPGTARYNQFLSAFYTGQAALQVGDDVRAETALAESVTLGGGEPATWVNWGVLALRQRNYDVAAQRLQQAHTLAPGNADIDYLLGQLESERGNSAAAITSLQAAVAADPTNIRAVYQLATEVERQADPNSNQRVQQLMQQILRTQPHNLAAQLELARIAAKQGDAATLQAAVRSLGDESASWPADIRQQFVQLQTAAQGAQPRAAAVRTTFLRNTLMRLPAFRNSLGDLRPPAGEGAQPMSRFLRVVNLQPRPAAADTALQFASQTKSNSTGWTWTGALFLNGEDAPVIAQGNGSHVMLPTAADLPFPGSGDATAQQPESVLPVDLNFDFKTDLVFAGTGGIRIYQQQSPAQFTDVTSSSKVSEPLLHAAYRGAWALDIEADGDLDILLGSQHGEPLLLRNNGDGTFAPEHPFPGIDGLQQVVWADLNGDGNPDAALLDSAGTLHLFLNRRSGTFEQVKLTAALGIVKAVTAIDLPGKDALSLVAVTADGRMMRLGTASDGGEWTTTELLRVPAADKALTGEVRLYAEDLDNNGAQDLVLSTVSAVAAQPLVWLGTDQGTFAPLPVQQPLRTFAIADVARNGHPALIGLTKEGSVVQADTHGSKPYHWQTIRPRARQATGDQRINSFGIGGEIETRSGLLVQKHIIRTPALHFGLGDQTQTQVARIFWPNGSVRAEFDLKADQQIVTEQRLKGSCPFLFAWNGHAMQFVKDSVPWGSAIGLRISALGSANISATEEWYKIGRDQLVPRNNFYDLRVTGELWETYYYDSLALMTVDHPAGTEIVADERYDVPAVKLAATPMAEPQPVQAAHDDQGHDVSSIVRSLDGVYLDNFGRGQYQGVTRDHYVEVELPATANVQQPLWLIARGWLHPSDSSINIALSQNSAPKPEWLRMEVQQNDGSWRVARPNLGFPAGRNKICLFDLSGVFRPGEPHRLRLRTNLEVYWDQIQWAEGRPQTPTHITRLNPTTADLHYRGFSAIHQANASSPELPQYNHLASTTALWRDLEGFYTRFGDVKELLQKPDDRYVIMNAGDEMSLRFAVPPPPPPGWVRDFIIAGDGWIKDGDYNSSHSETVLPYPHHSRVAYDSAPTPLQNDWEYQHHAADWQTYHTRYVTPHGFLSALRSSTDK